MTSLRSILIAGASGLVGQSLLNQSLADKSIIKVHVLVRRTLNIKNTKLIEHIVDFTQLPELPAVDEAYLAIGTTIKQAGGQKAFRAVDFDINLTIANAAVNSGITRIGLVSAMGAETTSRFFYNRVKGELEEAVKKLPFKTLVIARPSLMLSDRISLNQPVRAGESLANSLFKVLNPITPAKYKPIEATKVSGALLSAVPEKNGCIILSSKDMQ